MRVLVGLTKSRGINLSRQRAAACALLLGATVLSGAPAQALDIQGIVIAAREPGRPAAAVVGATADTAADTAADDNARCVSITGMAPTAAGPVATVEPAGPAPQRGAISIGTGVPGDAQSIRAGLAEFLGQPLDNDAPARVSTALIDILNREGRLLTDVYVPEQDVRDGILVIVAAPARLGKIVTRGQQYVDGAELACRMRLRPGDPVDVKLVASDLAWFNRSPWRRTDAAFTPGARPGESDIVLTTSDEKPLRWFTGYDNGGTPTTGLARWRAGVNWGSPFGHFDHRLDYSYAQASNAATFSSQTLAYSWPTAARDVVSASASLARTDVPLQGGVFRSTGANTQLSLSLSRVLGVDDLKPSLYRELNGGIEYKRIGSTLAFNQEPVSDTAPEVLQGFGAWNAGWSDDWGRNEVAGRVTLSPGNLGRNNRDAAFDMVRPGASSRYGRLNLSWDRYVDLPERWNMHGRANLQWTHQRLIASERVGISGAAGVRGYGEDVLYADAGLILNLELQSPYQNVRLFDRDGLWQALVFLDQGRSWNASDETNAAFGSSGRMFSLGSAGVGMRFNVNPTLTLRADLGFARTRLNSGGGRAAHVSVVVAF